ncbi:hypothetical protein E2I00_020119 [Balaenoptera physalus]|uniref:Calpain catalytic domain-containing protein n=1 Tax=Balaenoptera physalus TaxID=9770 RepID=A0A643C762_BALPH|nr:hypothetical protein E2I00_020119 [Balaenoptera physalus]
MDASVGFRSLNASLCIVLEMKLALPLVAVQDILEPCTVASLPNPHTPTFSSPTQAQISDADWDDLWDQFDERRYLSAKKWRVGADPYKLYAFNQRESERIASSRVVPDTRLFRCTLLGYCTDLPPTSIIITFHNEARSTLLRTVRSHCEVNRDWLQPLLHRVKEDYTRVVCPVIDIIHLDTFNYIESATELRGGFDWSLHFQWEQLTPAQKARRLDPTEPIRTPVIAGGLFVMDKSWFDYLGKYDMDMDIWGGENFGSGAQDERSGLIWEEHPSLMKSHLRPCRNQAIRGDSNLTYMAKEGHRNSCDSGPGEEAVLFPLNSCPPSWLVSLEIVPCSRVGHVFRKKHPYVFPDGNANTYIKNTKRTAEVWMDEYKQYYYASRPFALERPFGNIESRLNLRKNLQCRSFKWYLENVYPELRVPKESSIQKGSIRQRQKCLESQKQKDQEISNLKLSPCVKIEDKEAKSQNFTPSGVSSEENLSSLLLQPVQDSKPQAGCRGQIWAFTYTQQILQEELCLSVVTLFPGAPVVLVLCKNGDDRQQWTKTGSRIEHVASHLCLDTDMFGDGTENGREIVVNPYTVRFVTYCSESKNMTCLIRPECSPQHSTGAGSSCAIFLTRPKRYPSSKTGFYPEYQDLLKGKSEPHFILEGASSFDIQQGEAGDCCFLAALGSLTQNPQHLQKILMDQSFSYQYAGIFHFLFWQCGQWVEVVIDDRLPVLNNEYFFVNPRNKQEFWPSLLEKACAR